MSPSIRRLIIAGVPRAGKSMLCRRLNQQFGLSHIPLDSLVSTLGHIIPTYDVSHYGTSWEATATQFKPFLFEFLRHLAYENFSFMADGYHVLPRDIATLDRAMYRAVFLGYPHQPAVEKVALIRAHARPEDWTTTLSDAELRTIVQQCIDQSAQIAAECAHHDLCFVDTGTQFAQAIDSAYQALVHDD